MTFENSPYEVLKKSYLDKLSFSIITVWASTLSSTGSLEYNKIVLSSFSRNLQVKPALTSTLSQG